jgi:hypothetical protein
MVSSALMKLLVMMCEEMMIDVFDWIADLLFVKRCGHILNIDNMLSTDIA